MKLRYQLRGLGIGIIITALIMGAAAGSTEASMSDAAVIARAKELGMMENKPLAELETESFSEAASQPQTIDPALQSEAEDQLAETQKQKEDDLKKADQEKVVAQSEAQEPVATETLASPEKQLVIIEIKNGDGSDRVSKKLAEAGLIEDASAYDKYLCANGYDKTLRVGVHEIPDGATEEEIAKKLSAK